MLHWKVPGALIPRRDETVVISRKSKGLSRLPPGRRVLMRRANSSGTRTLTRAPGTIAAQPLTAVLSDACNAYDQLAVDLVFFSPMDGLMESNTAMIMDCGSYFSFGKAGDKVYIRYSRCCLAKYIKR